MIKLILLSKRTEPKTIERYYHEWDVIHVDHVKQVPEQEIRRYDHNYPLRGTLNELLTYSLGVPWDSLALLWWDSMEALGKCVTLPRYIEIVQPDGELMQSILLISEGAEEELIYSKKGEAGKFKVIRFLKRKPDMSGKDFLDYWKNKHAPLMLGDGLKDVTRKYVQSQCIEGNPFGIGSLGGYNGMEEFWFDNPEDMTKFWGNLGRLEKIRNSEAQFTDVARNVTITATEKNFIE
jgi:EthD domain